MTDTETHDRKPREVRIAPADLMDKPTVLGTQDLMDVLQIGVHQVGELIASGQLHRLAYSPRNIKVYRGEVLAFLERQTEAAVKARESEAP